MRTATAPKLLRPLLASLIAAVSLASAAEKQFTLPRETTKLRPDPGLPLITANCLLCHSADYISTRLVW